MTDDEPKTGAALQPRINALAALPSPHMDLVGPTVDDDIRRAIWRYGAEAVKEAVKEATKSKRGRREEPDWAELSKIFQDEADEWLAGHDPFANRSSYAIAKEFAKHNPGHSQVSTHKRIERKLSKKSRGRRWWVLHIAWQKSLAAHPHEAHLRTLKALAELPDGRQWKTPLSNAQGVIADYEAREGAPPVPEMTFREIEDAARNSTLLGSKMGPKGLFGNPRSI